VGDRRLAVFHVERGGFEEDVGLGGGEPVADVRRLWIRFPARGHECPRYTGLSYTGFGIQAVGIGDPAQPSGGDSGDAVGDAVASAEFFGAVFEEADESAVDVAEAEEAEVVGADATSQGLKPV
jgi:hypothetical protein